MGSVPGIRESRRLEGEYMLNENDILANKDYEKAISILEQLPNDNIEYQTHLALAYNDYALLKQSYFGDSKSAEVLYKKTIEISEKVTKDTNNPDLLNILALGYGNLGMIQLTYYGDYQSAEVNIKEAILICNNIIKDYKSPLILHTLALAYSNLGMLQDTYLCDIKSA